MTDQPYDSRPETRAHQARVYALGEPLAAQLESRLARHDETKLMSPEVEVFDEFTPKLRDSTYGSPEYMGYLAAMEPALKHHYAVNRHHPECHERGVLGMNLVDLIEMLVDWRAATERHADGSLDASLEFQRKRFGIPDVLMQILWNTARDFRMTDEYREEAS